jgi:hypothetical protein
VNALEISNIPCGRERAMAYDHVIRVADIKVRASSFEKVRKEIGAKEDQIFYLIRGRRARKRST